MDTSEEYSTPLSAMIEEFSLSPVFLPPNDPPITHSALNRPGLALSGFFEDFEPARVQIIGNAEYSYLRSLPPERRRESVAGLFARKPAAVLFTAGNPPTPEALASAKEEGVPLLTTKESTGDFSAALIAWLQVQLAPRITRHGVLVEVYGEGVLILGDSGIGKTETAIELVKRGHRLIADDAVEIKRVSARSLVGSAPDIIRHYAELRGIGIIDIRRIFGIGAVKLTEKIEMVIDMVPWEAGSNYDRFGLSPETTEIMGITLPKVTIPVRAGRNLAIIIEIAAMTNRERRMGYNTAEEFNRRLTEQLEKQ